MRIALFTPFNPMGGGGAVIFRSLLPYLPGAEVHWFYLSHSKVDYPNSTLLGPPILGGSFLKDAIGSGRLFVLQSHPEVSRIVQAIQAWAPDIAWVNAMNEGLLVGKGLSQAGCGKLHVSVHDDPAGLAQKSRRYKHLAGVLDKRNRSLLQQANTIDVVSEPMRRYYMQRYGVDSGVVYRHLHNPEIPAAASGEGSTTFVGHVGSAYSKPELVAFMTALRMIESESGRKFKILAFGTSPALTAAANEFPGLVESAGNVEEATAVQQLQRCTFVYSMYAFDPSHKIFRETSLPTKMSTYLMAAKPILAHCPQGSSMIEMVENFKLGCSVTSLDANTVAASIREILNFKLEKTQVSRALEFYCGPRNIDFLADCFQLAPRPVTVPTSAVGS